MLDKLYETLKYTNKRNLLNYYYKRMANRIINY